MHIGLIMKMLERHDSISLLGLDPDRPPRIQELESRVDGCLHRNILQGGAGLWPTLKQVWIPISQS